MAATDTAKRWRIRPRSKLDLAAIDPRSKAGAPGDKVATKAGSQELRAELRELQARLWAESRQSLLIVLSKTSTKQAPRYVIPGDRNWYRDWAVLTVLVETLRGMDPQFPAPEEDLAGVVIEW